MHFDSHRSFSRMTVKSIFIKVYTFYCHSWKGPMWVEMHWIWILLNYNMRILQVAFLRLFNYLDSLPKLYYKFILVQIITTSAIHVCIMAVCCKSAQWTQCNARVHYDHITQKHNFVFVCTLSNNKLLILIFSVFLSTQIYIANMRRMV